MGAELFSPFARKKLTFMTRAVIRARSRVSRVDMFTAATRRMKSYPLALSVREPKQQEEKRGEGSVQRCPFSLAARFYLQFYARDNFR